MHYKSTYDSPVGMILLASNGEQITGLWLGNQCENAAVALQCAVEEEISVLRMCKHWLDAYFDGKRLDEFQLPLAPLGNLFRQTVWQILREIPYGTVVTYADVAAETARRIGKPRMSAQAVGGAVGHNPISLLIPCHRVIGRGGKLTGYAGGLDIKRTLLQHECVMINEQCKPTVDLWSPIGIGDNVR